MTTTNVREKVTEYLLENVDELQQIANEIHSYSGNLEHLQFWENDEEFFETFFSHNPMEAVRASFYGDYRYADQYVRFNGYGNLESLEEYQIEDELRDNVDEIIDLMIENRENIDLPDEVEELLEQMEEEE